MENSSNLRAHLVFKDRVGVVADISRRLARADLSIVSMEVQRLEHLANVYLEVEASPDAAGRSRILEILRIPDLQSIRFIQSLPRETRENTFRVVLDNVSDGILSIDHQGKVQTINRMARKILELGTRDVEGEPLENLAPPDRKLMECLQGKAFSHSRRTLPTAAGRTSYFAAGKPIYDSNGRIFGAVEIMRDMKEVRELAKAVTHPEKMTFGDFIGESPTVQEALSFARKIATTDFIVSIRGESGTGKELLAQAIHTASDRDGPFLPLNCAALPEPLLESELFGYVDGAFTGARRGGKKGLLEAAENGTVFLDEIADLSPGPQAKLLRVIQEKSLRRIGGGEEIPVHARIITATNRNLERMVDEGSFRKDLYYRINVLPIHIPPLKERKEDIPMLAEHFLLQFNSRLGKAPQVLEAGGIQRLLEHSWPGNVRELRNTVERAAILTESEHIDEAEILLSFRIARGAEASPGDGRLCQWEDRSLQNLVGTYEEKIIRDALSRARSIRRAAVRLGVSHTTLLNKIKKYKIQVERNPDKLARFRSNNYP